MTSHDSPNTRSASTSDYQWARILRGRPRPQGDSTSKTSRHASLRSRDPRKPITVQLVYRGGSEGLWRADARGLQWTFPGWMTLMEVMGEINKTRDPRIGPRD
jgi:hypothetical protein